MEIIGRTNEQHVFNLLLASQSPEFLAVYGRRRVGKTFLIKEFFQKEFIFYISGAANATKKEQLENFQATLIAYSKYPYTLAKNWSEAFRQLIHLAENSHKRGKKVIFIDELPWFDTPRSGFITGLEYFWNTWASSRPDILLIACGSATSWMLNNLLKNRGGLHNRVTRRMALEPFTLGECEAYFKSKKIVFDRKSIIDIYMAFGGIPYYLNLFEKGLSVTQNINNLCFAKNAALKDEFSVMLSSLFKRSENHLEIMQALAKKRCGLTRDEIVEATSLQGGGLTAILEELEQCGYINVYDAYRKKSKEKLYQLIDFYSLFYLNFISKRKGKDPELWTKNIESATRRAWSGYAFEQVCLAHITQIRRKLGIAGVVNYAASWRSKKVAKGAQIDLLLDRNDNVINICEMKYSQGEYVIDKDAYANIRNKRTAFIAETKSRKTVHLTFITPYGVFPNEYREHIQSEVTMDDLF